MSLILHPKSARGRLSLGFLAGMTVLMVSAGTKPCNGFSPAGDQIGASAEYTRVDIPGSEGPAIQTSQESPAPAKKTPHCLIDSLPGAPNSARLPSFTKDQKECLDSLAEALNGTAGSKLIIYGHRNPSEASGVSLVRANLFKDYFVEELGIDAASISIKTTHDTCPHESNKEKKNRRVQLWVVPEGKENADDEALKNCGSTAPAKPTPPGHSGDFGLR